MGRIKPDYIERLYAGWLGKLIGVRHGAPVEGWSDEKIAKIYGEITGYPVNYRDFAADDDTNGPLFMLRALSDYGVNCTPEQMGLTLLNYAPYEHGFFWWGGYGISTEHTAYLNLRAGIPAPLSGSIEMNGEAQAEQIGGQIFIDTWGLVCPGDPLLAADYAKRAAGVTHGGNGVYGGMFIAACIASAFNGIGVRDVIEAGLSVIPPECAYARVVRHVMAFWEDEPDDWRACFAFVKQNYGYDRYPGACHIIPNAAVVALSLLYGRGDFGRTVNITVMCGWDTDCNAGNVGAVMGVLTGLEGIDYDKWRAPINDFYVSSGLMGCLNINDAPRDVCLIARLAYQIAREAPPHRWAGLIGTAAPLYAFALPGATHGFRARGDKPSHGTLEMSLRHVSAVYETGCGSLCAAFRPLSDGQRVRVYTKTHYRPADFHDSRYDPCFSPLVYPGQRIMATVSLAPDIAYPVRACLYALDENLGREFTADPVMLAPGLWREMVFDIAPMPDGLIAEIGVLFIPVNPAGGALTAYIDRLHVSGKPDYGIDFSLTRNERWTFSHREVSQFSYLRGHFEVSGGYLYGNGPEWTETYTGRHDWTDYRFTGTVCPLFGDTHRLLFRVQGAVRSYAAGFFKPGKIGLWKNQNGYVLLAETDFAWEIGGEYTLTVIAVGNTIRILSDDREWIHFTDQTDPYLTGAVGAGVPKGRCRYKDFWVKGI